MMGNAGHVARMEKMTTSYKVIDKKTCKEQTSL